MIEHKHCAPPRGEKIVIALRLGVYGRTKLVRNKPDHALAYVTEDRSDSTRAVIWLPDCACVEDPTCPRTKMRAWTASRYDVTDVKLRPAISAAKARGGH